MTPLKALKEVVKILKTMPCKFCLIGGHAASLYRKQERFTKDVDFALVANDSGQSRKIAEACISALGLKPAVGFIPFSKSKQNSNVLMITSTPVNAELTGVVDILLPEIPWVQTATERAQNNKIDLIFDKVPVITAEDLIISKCYSLDNNPDRFQDLDDLKEVFQNANVLDYDYIYRVLKDLRLEIPSVIQKYVPLRIK